MTMSLDEIRTYGQKVHSTWLPEEFEAWAIAKQQVDANVMGWYEFVPWQQTMDLIEAPTLLVFGDSDKGGIVSRQIAEEACRINTHVQSTHIPGAGHNIHRERFESYIAAVRTFLL
jgi:pimeloyl-ACP methyl ester carboxylesterase